MAKDRKDPRQMLVRRLTVNMTEPEYEVLVELAKSWGSETPRLYLQRYVREHVKWRLAKHDQEAQVL